MAFSRIVRDKLARTAASAWEVQREALRVICRTRDIPLSIRLKAQLELSQFRRYLFPNHIQSRCTHTYKAKGGISEFKLHRWIMRREAHKGAIPGVRKARF